MSLLKRKILPVFKKIKLGTALFFGKIFKKNKKRSLCSTNQVDLDRKLVHSLSRSKIPNLRQLKYIKRFLSTKELWMIRILILVIIVNAGVLGFNFYKQNFQVVPAQGGEYVEGVIGSPQYINPLYTSVSDVDKDIADLVFSGLFEFNDDQGLVKDLVSEYSVSSDKKTYTLKIRDDVQWHHGKKLTAHDVVFTFNTIKDPEYDSPLRSKFTGVRAEQLGEYSLKFILETKNPRFLSMLTFGVMPADLWSQATPQSIRLNELNLEPIGSGPYEFQSLVKNKRGNIISCTLKANNNYYDQAPYIRELVFRFFVSPEEAINALNKNQVDGLGYLPPDGEEQLIAKGSLNIHKPKLPQVNSLFFNKNINEILKSGEVRKALTLAIDKNKIVSEVIGNDGQRVHSLLPSYLDSYNDQVNKYEYDAARAEKLLQESDWGRIKITPEEIEALETLKQRIESQQEGTSTEESKNNEEELELSEEQRVKLELGEGEWMVRATTSRESEELGFRDCLIIELTVPDDNRNTQIAERVKKYWEELGIRTELRKVPSSNMYSEVIKTRDFEALLYAQVFSVRPDLYPFWHSSEVQEGLNIVGYSNEEVDKLLQEARGLEWGSPDRVARYKSIQEKIIQEIPLIPLYNPNYTYVQNNSIKGVKLDHIISPHNRFSQVENWYTKTGKKLVW